MFFETGCKAVDVEHTDHWRAGNTGQWFYFSETEMDQLLGRKHWSNEKFDVIQKGSHFWYGKVVLWKDTKTSPAHGRRNIGSAEGQWSAGDTIELQDCSGK